MNESLKKYYDRLEDPNCFGYAAFALRAGEDGFYFTVGIFDRQIAEEVVENYANSIAFVVSKPTLSVAHIVPFNPQTPDIVDHRPYTGASNVIFNASLKDLMAGFQSFDRNSKFIYYRIHSD